MKPRLQEKYDTEIHKKLKEQFNLNPMAVPRLKKITLNVGMGTAHSNPKGLETAMNELATITGQRPVKTMAKKSIAGFKIREEMVLGCMVTLRGARMYEFLDRLINLALPRVRDFRGVSPKAFDGRGNYNLGVKEQIMFPEIDFDKVDSVHGMNITFVTNTNSNEQAKALLTEFNFPFRK